MSKLIVPQINLRSSLRGLLGLGMSVIVLVLCLLICVRVGAADISIETIWRSLIHFDGSTDGSTEQLIIRTVRLPRVFIAVLVGAALGIAGALMQGLTRNPLADPGILGISSGASLAIVSTIFIWGSASPQSMVWVAFAGAAIAATSVYGLGSLGKQGTTPLKLTLAGALLSYFLSALTTGLLVVNQRTLDEVRFWLAGSIAGRDAGLLLQVLPYLAVGLVIALALSPSLTVMALGEDVAKGLGLRLGWIKIWVAIAVILLAGGAVALAGPIGFVGLIIPHMVRLSIGNDYRWLMPYAAVWGAILLLVADLVARLVLRPQELPVGIMTALLGAPFFIHLARSRINR